jgi:branched-chain amino acid transport system substrate-binding protein
MLTTTSQSDEITKSGQWAFKTPASASVTEETAKYAVQKAGVKRVAIVFARDNEGQIAQKEVAKKYFQGNGVTIPFEESILTSDSEFLALITKLTSLNVDGIFLTLVAEQGANFIVQARQAGISPKIRFFGTTTMAAPRFIAVGGKAVEGATFSADYFPGSKAPENKQFMEAFQAKYKRVPDNFAALGYTAVKVAAAAIRAAGPNSSREQVRAQLAKTRNMPSILGSNRFSFDENRNPQYGAYILWVQNGQFAEAPALGR